MWFLLRALGSLRLMAPGKAASAEPPTRPAATLLPVVAVPAPEFERVDWSAARPEQSSRFVRDDRDAVYRHSLALADALAACCALFVSIAAGRPRPSFIVLATVPLIVIMSKLFGMYDREDLLVRKSTLDEAPVLFQLATMYALIVWLMDGLVIAGARDRRELLALWITLFLSLVLFRTAARSLSRRLTPRERCLVIGDATTCEWMQNKFARRPSLHAAVVASVAPSQSDHDQNGAALRFDGVDLQALSSQLAVDRVLITPGGADQEGVVDLVHAATSIGLKVSVLPRVLEVIGTSVQFDDVEGVPLLSMRPLGLSRYSRAVKRSLDFIGSSVALLVLAPLLAGIAIAIRLDTRGPALFRQRRVGRDGRRFEMVKFRTMIPGAEDQKDELRHLNEAAGLFKITEDPRITAGRPLSAPHLVR